MNTIERKRLSRNWPYLFILAVLILATCAMDKPEDRKGHQLSNAQQREIIERQQGAHSLEMAAMVKNQARRW